ncbi:hypothetical protein CVN56_21190 [Rhodococcus sp. AQ5-07]|nr:hypothetical protein CVN56_21190 [Rhodococcus sp. AQ5-07]
MDTAAKQLARRREASRRVPPLDCGCPDPWPCKCSVPPLSDRVADSWRDAAAHILFTGKCPIVPFEVLRALYRRGGEDRGIAVEIFHRSGGVIA